MMDAAAESGRNERSERSPWVCQMRGMARDGTVEPAKFSGANGDRGILIFPVFS